MCTLSCQTGSESSSRVATTRSRSDSSTDEITLDKAYAEAIRDETEGNAGRDLETQKVKLEEADTTVVKLPVAEIITQPEMRDAFVALLSVFVRTVSMASADERLNSSTLPS